VPPQQCTKVIVLHGLLVLRHEASPLLLALFVLHLILVDLGRGIEVRKLAVEVLEDPIIEFREAELTAATALEDVPISLRMDYGFDGELFFDLTRLLRRRIT
jgi:hypothetical protein